MSYYDEDFYCEPSEFEVQIGELKQSLMNSVKQEYTTEMERLKAENAELQEIKKNFEQIKNDYKGKEHQLEIERSDLVRKVRNERLSILMKDFEVVMFRATSTAQLPPKCDKCDEKRLVRYKTPLGRDTHENCDCSIGKRAYVPTEYICSEFRVDRDNKQMMFWYKMKSERDYDYATFDSSSTFAKKAYNGDSKYEDLNYYETFFKSQEDCQKYCDWLTEQK